MPDSIIPDEHQNSIQHPVPSTLYIVPSTFPPVPMSLLLLLSLLADSHIHGIVRDSATRAPLHGAMVKVIGTKKGAITDRYGAFHIHDVPGDSAHVDVSYVGYRTAHVAVVNDRDVRIDVALSQQTSRGSEIIVTDARIDHSALPTQRAVVLSSAEVDEHRGQTFADALTEVSGVTLLQTGPSLKKPMINGMTGTRLVLRNNNVIQEGQQWGIEHAPEIDAFSPYRITVVKGPASVMYGPNAIGGVIDLETRPIRQDPGLHGESTLNLFSNGRQAALGLFLETANVAGSGVDVRLQGSTRKGGDASAPNYVTNNTGVEELNGSLTLQAGNEDLGITAIGSLFTTTLGIFKGAHIGNGADLLRAIELGSPLNPQPFSYDITNPRQEISHALVSIKGHVKTAEDHRVTLTFGHQINDRNEFDGHNTRIVGRGEDPVARAQDSIARLTAALQVPAMNLLLSTSTLDATFEHALSDRIRGAAGVTSMWQTNDRSGAVILIPDYRLWGLGAFIYESMTINDITLSGGLRYDVRDLKALIISRSSNQSAFQMRQWSNITGSIGALWNVSEDVTASVNIATAWRPPQVNELYSNDVHHGSAYYEVGDSTLTNERVLGGDASLTYDQGILRLEASGFYHAIDGYIMALPDVANPTVTVRGTFPTYRFTQLPARMYGGDINVRVDIHERLDFYGSGAIVRGYDNRHGEPLLFVPADRARVGAHLHTDDIWQIHDAYVDVSIMGVRRQTNIIPGRDYAEPPAGYLRTDVSVGGVLELSETMLARLTLSCTNLFNVAYRDYLSQYRYFTDDPGRNIILRFTTSF